MCPTNLPESSLMESILAEQCMNQQEGPCIRMIGHKTQDYEPCGRGVLLGSLSRLLSTQAPLLNKVSCCVSTCVSSDNSFLSVRQEPTSLALEGVPLPSRESLNVGN